MRTRDIYESTLTSHILTPPFRVAGNGWQWTLAQFS